MEDDNLTAKFHLDAFNRFAGMHVSLNSGKTQGWDTLGENLGMSKRRQPRVVHIALGRRRMGLLYGRDPTLISLLV